MEGRHAHRGRCRAGDPRLDGRRRLAPPIWWARQAVKRVDRIRSLRPQLSDFDRGRRPERRHSCAPYSGLRGGARPRVLVINENESVPSDRRVWAISQTLVRAGCDVVVVCPQGDESERASGRADALRDPRRRARSTASHCGFASGGLPGYIREYGAALWKARRVVACLSRKPSSTSSMCAARPTSCSSQQHPRCAAVRDWYSTTMTSAPSCSRPASERPPADPSARAVASSEPRCARPIRCSP